MIAASAQGTHPETATDGGTGAETGSSFAGRLAELQAEMRADPVLRGVNRIAAALYEPAGDLVKTFVQASDGPNPVQSVAMPLASLPALRGLAETGETLVVHDLSAAGRTMSWIAGGLVLRGYRARFVAPVLQNDTLFGFLFFNSFTPGYFKGAVLRSLAPYRRLIASLLIHDLAMTRTVLAAVRSAGAITRLRDEETGGHLERMARYAQLIARRLAPVHGLSDEWVEYLFEYAPLHDIGKVAVPDSILLKPGRLTPDEFTVMQTHVNKGLEIVDRLRRDLGAIALPHARLLRNIVACHHEALDGGGYPNGLAGTAIPLEGRITAVADVFDALTSVRPYKEAWSIADAVAFLRAESGRRFDPACVDALVGAIDEAVRIHRDFADGVAD